MEIIHGSGNVFSDLGVPNAEEEQQKCLIAADIISRLNRDELSEIRKGNCHRFTLAKLEHIQCLLKRI